MKEDNEEIVLFYKKRVEPFVAIFILAFLIVGCILLYQDNQLKKEISKNCGWEKEKYRCYCEKSFIEDIQGRMGNNLGGFEINVSMDGRDN
jgi:hypothetical protein